MPETAPEPGRAPESVGDGLRGPGGLELPVTLARENILWIWDETNGVEAGVVV